ncbi:hypothetical protein N7453_006371 [Penicillium expansum]|nr:hypothetical protein N7453_006371 [Penicillium expansum]
MSSSGGAPPPLESQAPTVKGLMWTMSMVPLILVLMRLYVRVYMRRVSGWDDGIAIAAIITSSRWHEDSLAITAASIPALKPLLTKIFLGTKSDNYNMIPYLHLPPNRKVFDNSAKRRRTLDIRVFTTWEVKRRS